MSKTSLAISMGGTSQKYIGNSTEQFGKPQKIKLTTSKILFELNIFVFAFT